MSTGQAVTPRSLIPRRDLTLREMVALAMNYQKAERPEARQFIHVIMLDQLVVWSQRDSRYVAAFLHLLLLGSRHLAALMARSGRSWPGLHTVELPPVPDLYTWLSYRIAQWMCTHLASLDRG